MCCQPPLTLEIPPMRLLLSALVTLPWEATPRATRPGLTHRLFGSAHQESRARLAVLHRVFIDSLEREGRDRDIDLFRRAEILLDCHLNDPPCPALVFLVGLPFAHGLRYRQILAFLREYLTEGVDDL